MARAAPGNGIVDRQACCLAFLPQWHESLEFACIGDAVEYDGDGFVHLSVYPEERIQEHVGPKPER